MLDMALDDARGFPSLSAEPNECVIVSRPLPPRRAFLVASLTCLVFLLPQYQAEKAQAAYMATSSSAAVDPNPPPTFVDSRVIMETFNLLPTSSSTTRTGTGTDPSSPSTSSPSVAPFTPSAFFAAAPTPSNGLFAETQPTPSSSELPPNLDLHLTPNANNGPTNRQHVGIVEPFGGASAEVIKKLFEEFNSEAGGGGFGGMWSNEFDNIQGSGAMDWGV